MNRPPEPAAADDPGPALSVVSSDGVRLCVRDMGGTGPDLLMGHATGFHGWAYSPMAARLTGSFRVWLLDFRGHGLSGRPADGNYGWDAMGADAAAAADAINAKANDAAAGTEVIAAKAGVIASRELYGFGHSMGANALVMAELARPGRFAGLFLYEPVIAEARSFLAGAQTMLVEAARRRREVFDDRAEARARYAARPPLDALRADALDAYVQTGFTDRPDGRVGLACPPEIEAATFAGRTQIFDRLGGVGPPTVVAAGPDSNEEPGPSRFAAAVARALPRGRLIRYRRLGHLGPLQDPDAAAADVVAALLGAGRPGG